jgi:hypothetical protein
LGREETLTLLHFGADETFVELEMPIGTWKKRLDSAEPTWLGMGSPLSAEIVSSGRVSVRVAGKSVALFVRSD